MIKETTNLINEILPEIDPALFKPLWINSLKYPKKIIITSTPKGSNTFFKLWEKNNK